MEQILAVDVGDEVRRGGPQNHHDVVAGFGVAVVVGDSDSKRVLAAGGIFPEDVHEGAEGRIHCVCQTRSVSWSGAAGAVAESLATFILTRRQAVPPGWHVDGFGQLSDDARRSRLGMFGLVCPSAW